MRAQLEYLKNRLDDQRIVVQILPLSQGHPTTGDFTILRFQDPDVVDIVHVEQVTSALYLDRPAMSTHTGNR
jgi:Domain of unknown function (DUF5753)